MSDRVTDPDYLDWAQGQHRPNRTVAEWQACEEGWNAAMDRLFANSKPAPWWRRPGDRFGVFFLVVSVVMYITILLEWFVL